MLGRLTCLCLLEPRKDVTFGDLVCRPKYVVLAGVADIFSLNLPRILAVCGSHRMIDRRIEAWRGAAGRHCRIVYF